MPTNPYDEGLDRQDLPMPIQEVGDEGVVKTDLGRVMILPRGTFDISATYGFLDIVYYNGYTFVCVKDSTTGVIPAISPNDPAHPWKILGGTEGAMPATGGTFTGNVKAYNEDRSSPCLRNIEVRETNAGGELQSTNKIIMVRV